MFTLRLTVRGQVGEPTEHESFMGLGDALAWALGDAGMDLHPRVIATLQSLILSDLRTHSTWTWVAEDYEIFVARDDL